MPIPPGGIQIGRAYTHTASRVAPFRGAPPAVASAAPLTYLLHFLALALNPFDVSAFTPALHLSTSTLTLNLTLTSTQRAQNVGGELTTPHGAAVV